jgi:hypothetical protein
MFIAKTFSAKHASQARHFGFEMDLERAKVVLKEYGCD